jgi:hypothetical protein
MDMETWKVNELGGQFFRQLVNCGESLRGIVFGEIGSRVYSVMVL